MNDKVQQIVSLLKNVPELAKMAPVIAKPLADHALKVAKTQARELGDNPLLHAAVQQLRQVPALKPAVDVAGELWSQYVGCDVCVDEVTDEPDRDRPDDRAPVAVGPTKSTTPRASSRAAQPQAAKTPTAAPSPIETPAAVAPQTTVRPEAQPARKAAPQTPAPKAAPPAKTAAKAKKASPGASARPVARAARTGRGADLLALSKADLMRVAEERGITTRKSQSREQILELLNARR